MADNQQYLTPTRTGIRPRFGRVLVTVDKEFDDEVKVGNTTLYLDTTYKPLHHVQEYATVVATPLEMRGWDTTPCEVEVGDQVRMHYHAISDAHLVVLDSKRHWLVPYDLLYYVARPDGLVKMLNDKVLVEPVLSSGGEERTLAGLITNNSGKPRPVSCRGTVRHTPEGCPLPLGATIAFLPDADIPLKVGEETLYVMDYRREILAAL